MEKVQQIYSKILKVVIDTTSVPMNDFFSSMLEESVDARCLLVEKLVSIGFTERQIGKLTDMSQQRVNYLKNSYQKRMKKMPFAQLSEEIDKELTRILQIAEKKI